MFCSVFFFKQKTADEMRISDWSSDVCSSDLELEAEVVVVDNDSDDDSAAVAERRGVKVVHNADNEGYARGMNAALADTDAPVLIALNPDTEAPPGSLAALVARLRGEPGDRKSTRLNSSH